MFQKAICINVKRLLRRIRELSEDMVYQRIIKPTNTLCQLLAHPKDPVGKDKVVGPVYKISCDEYEATYVGETERSLKARFGEHRRPSSTTSEVLKHIHTDSQPRSYHHVGEYVIMWSTND